MSLVVPPIPGGSDAVRAIFVKFDQQAQRLRSILRLLLVVVMILIVFSGTSRADWPAQIGLVACYAALSAIAAWLWLRDPNRARRLRALEPMVPVDIAAICTLQFLSTGSYLALGLLAFLPFFIATQAGRRAAVMSVASIAAGGIAVISDPVFRQQMSTLAIVTVLVMLALLCYCSYTVSRVQQRRLASIAELTASRSVLLADVMTAEERERRGVAEALHDGALQTVLAAKQDLREALNAGASAEVARAWDLLGDVSRDLRDVTRELHPSVLDEAGLGAAVQALAAAFSERTGVPVQCTIGEHQPHPDDATIYGVARELLSNVARHAQARTVWVELGDHHDVVTLDVRDDGVGVDAEVMSRRLREGHIGLASHRARVETLGGTMAFRKTPQGSWIHVEIPIRVGQEAQ